MAQIECTLLTAYIPCILLRPYTCRPSTSQFSRSVSLAPSDSLSQAPSRTPSSSFLPSISPFHQPASRPDQYPFAVLWCLDDCKHDNNCKISTGNDSRPAMNTAVRNPDGSSITDGVWDAIKSSSRQVAQSLLSMIPTGREAHRSQTKKFFKTSYSNEWSQCITHIEQLQPLLQLCASHWKAEHVLGGTLASIVQSKSTKRRAEADENTATKKPRQDLITANAIRGMHERNGKAGNTINVLSTPVGPPLNTPDALLNTPDTPLNTPEDESALGVATFTRKPVSKPKSAATNSKLNNTAASATSANSSKPSPVDSSYENLKCTCFTHYLTPSVRLSVAHTRYSGSHTTPPSKRCTD